MKITNLQTNTGNIDLLQNCLMTGQTKTVKGNEAKGSAFSDKLVCRLDLGIDDKVDMDKRIDDVLLLLSTFINKISENMPDNETDKLDGKLDLKELGTKLEDLFKTFKGETAEEVVNNNSKENHFANMDTMEKFLGELMPKFKDIVDSISNTTNPLKFDVDNKFLNVFLNRLDKDIEKDNLMPLMRDVMFLCKKYDKICIEPRIKQDNTGSADVLPIDIPDINKEKLSVEVPSVNKEVEAKITTDKNAIVNIKKEETEDVSNNLNMLKIDIADIIKNINLDANSGNGYPELRKFENGFLKVLMNKIKNIDDGTESVKIALNPEKLGRIDVEIVEEKGKKNIVLTATTNEIRDLLSASLNELKAQLSDKNININNFNFDLFGNSNSGNSFGHNEKQNLGIYGNNYEARHDTSEKNYGSGKSKHVGANHIGTGVNFVI